MSLLVLHLREAPFLSESPTSLEVRLVRENSERLPGFVEGAEETQPAIPSPALPNRGDTLPDTFRSSRDPSHRDIRGSSKVRLAGPVGRVGHPSVGPRSQGKIAAALGVEAGCRGPNRSAGGVRPYRMRAPRREGKRVPRAAGVMSGSAKRPRARGTGKGGNCFWKKEIGELGD